MEALANLVVPVKVKVRAAVDEYKKGQQIISKGQVDIDNISPLVVTAKVTEPDGSVQRTRLASQPDGLHWVCTCNPDHKFCKHLVATALVAHSNAPAHYNKKAED